MKNYRRKSLQLGFVFLICALFIIFNSQGYSQTFPAGIFGINEPLDLQPIQMSTTC